MAADSATHGEWAAHVTEYGEPGSGPTLVLGHAITTDRSTLAAMARHLGSRHHVITWDSRGHGARGAPSGSFTHEDLARDLMDLLETFDLDRAVVGGVSQGAFVSLDFALVAPDRVVGLVLIACRADPIPREVVPSQREAIARWADAGLDRDHARWMAEMNFGVAEPGNDEWVDHWMARDGSSYVESFEALFAMPDRTGRLAEIAAPAVVIRGEMDGWIPARTAADLAAGLPGSGPPVTIPGAAHVTPATHPTATAEVIERFLDGLGAGR